MQKWDGNDIDLETYSTVSTKGFGRRRTTTRCGCNMCNNIYAWKAEYMSQAKSMKSAARHSATVKAADAMKAALKESAQAPTPSGHMDTGIRIANIGPDDIIGEFGCGIAEWSIRAIESGARRAYGFEIDIDMVKKARKHVQEAVVAGRIAPGSVVIQHRDVRDVDPAKYHLTIGLTYLYPDLLAELKDAGKFNYLDKVVSPYHQINGLQSMVEHDEVWLWTKDPADQPFKRSFHTFVPMTESPPVLTAKVKTQKPVLLFYHFDGCPACRTWERQQRSRMEFDVADRGVADGSMNGVTYYPAFQVAVKEEDGTLRILKKDDGKRYHWGFSSAQALNYQLKRIEKDLNAGS
jgi:hypothetical protein